MSANWPQQGLYPAPPYPSGAPPEYSQYAPGYTEYAAPTAPASEQPAPAPVREAEAARPAFSWKRAIFSGSMAYLVLHYSFRVVNPNAASISFVVGMFFGFLGDPQRKSRIFVQRLNPFHYLPRIGSYTPAPSQYPVPEVVITPVIVETHTPAPQPVRVTSTFGFVNTAPYGSTSFGGQSYARPLEPIYTPQSRVVKTTVYSTPPVVPVLNLVSSMLLGGSSSTPPPGPTISNVRSVPPARPAPTSSSSASPPPLGRAVRAHQPNSRPPQSGNQY